MTPPRQPVIVIIAHDPGVSQMLGVLLSDAGFRPVSAENLDAAANLLSTLKADLVITDYVESWHKRGERWPILEMFKALADPGTPFVVLTTSPQAIEQDVGQLGVAALVAKPFDLENLLQRVREAIEGRAGGIREREAAA